MGDSWVKLFNFSYNPFGFLEASGDPNLSSYLIGHEIYSLAREDAATFVFAPTGGGKTAMRIFVMRACWMSMGGRQPFPIPYVLPQQAQTGEMVPLGQHLQWLLNAGARALLAGLSYRPERFIECSLADQCQIVGLLDHFLAGALPYYTVVLEESDSPQELLHLLNWPNIIPDPPSEKLKQQFIAHLRNARQNAHPQIPPDPQDQFEVFQKLLTGPLGFRSIYLLIDGIDAFAETINNIGPATRLILPLLEQIPLFIEQNAYIKAFLPQYIRPYLAEMLPEIYPNVQNVQLRWTPELLAEMTRRRVTAASGGAMGSLDALSDPDVRDVENILANSLKVKLPRQMLLAVGKLMARAAESHSQPSGKITREILDAVVHDLQKEMVPA